MNLFWITLPLLGLVTASPSTDIEAGARPNERAYWLAYSTLLTCDGSKRQENLRDKILQGPAVKGLTQKDLNVLYDWAHKGGCDKVKDPWARSPNAGYWQNALADQKIDASLDNIKQTVQASIVSCRVNQLMYCRAVPADKIPKNLAPYLMDTKKDTPKNWKRIDPKKAKNLKGYSQDVEGDLTKAASYAVKAIPGVGYAASLGSGVLKLIGGLIGGACKGEDGW